MSRKTVAETAKVTVWMTNRKSHAVFRFTPKSMTLDDFELLLDQILSEFRVISWFWEATIKTAKRMKMDA